MNINITFRHMDATEALKAHANEKVAKIQRFLRQPMTAKVTLSVERHEQVAEIQISSGGQHLEAKEHGEDIYGAIDKVTEKLERQINGAKGAAQAKARRSSETTRQLDAMAAAASLEEA